MTGPLMSRAFIAEGARVGLATCTRCYAALFIDPNDTFNVGVEHMEWHDRLDAAVQKKVDNAIDSALKRLT